VLPQKNVLPNSSPQKNSSDGASISISCVSIGELSIKNSSVILNNVIIIDTVKNDTPAVYLENATLTGSVLDITTIYPEKNPNRLSTIFSTNSSLNISGGGINGNNGIAIIAKNSKVCIEHTNVIGRIEILEGTSLTMKNSTQICASSETLIERYDANDRILLCYVIFTGLGEFIKRGLGNSHRLGVGANGKAYKFDGGENTQGRFV